MALTRSEISRRWRTKNPDAHKANYDDWRVANKEKRNEYARKWHANKRATDPKTHAKKVRRSILKRRYGITPEQYETMLAAQGGHCALCDRTPADERFKHLSVDHCHGTGHVRGLLCMSCNQAIGKLGDDENGLLRALNYLRGSTNDPYDGERAAQKRTENLRMRALR
jgi:hypothetical protein